MRYRICNVLADVENIRDPTHKDRFHQFCPPHTTTFAQNGFKTLSAEFHAAMTAIYAIVAVMFNFMLRPKGLLTFKLLWRFSGQLSLLSFMHDINRIFHRGAIWSGLPGLMKFTHFLEEREREKILTEIRCFIQSQCHRYINSSS